MNTQRFDWKGEPVLVENDSMGVGHCTESCYQHDGKRCSILGMRPSSICEVWCWVLIEQLDELRGNQP